MKTTIFENNNPQKAERQKAEGRRERQ